MKNTEFFNQEQYKYQTLYGTVCFLLMYLFLLYYGTACVFFISALYERGKMWPPFPVFLIVGLIISASSLLGKMFYTWRRNVRERKKIEKE